MFLQANKCFPRKESFKNSKKYKEFVCDRDDLRGPGVPGDPIVLLNMNWILDMFLKTFQSFLQCYRIKTTNIISSVFIKRFLKG